MKSEHRPRLVVLVPAYNEADRIEPTLRSYLTHTKLNTVCDMTVVPVLNGCKDTTREVVDAVAAQFPDKMSVLEDTRPIGKGGATIMGFKYPWNADYVGFTDADNSTTPDMYVRLIQTLIDTPNLDCAIASRYIAGARVQGKMFTRVVMSETFSAIVNILFWLGIKDTQCGAKILTQEAVNTILPKLHLKNMAFDVNMLVALRHHHKSIQEVAIDWNDDTQSSLTGKAHITSFFMLWSLVRMRISLSPLKGLYRALLMPIDKWLWTTRLGHMWEEF